VPFSASEATSVFEALAREVIEPLRRYLARRTDPATAADVLSEALLVLWRRLEDVPLEAPLPYAYTVARNCLYNAQRSAVRQQRLAERIAVIDPPTEAVPAHDDQRDEHEDGAGSWGVEDEDVRRAIAALPEASAEVVRLWAWEQLSPAQIARVVGSSANAVSIRLHRAKKQLAAFLTVAPTPPSPPADLPPPRGGPPGRPSPGGGAPDRALRQRPDREPDQRREQEWRQP